MYHIMQCAMKQIFVKKYNKYKFANNKTIKNSK